jgi:hypothetical protein
LFDRNGHTRKIRPAGSVDNRWRHDARAGHLAGVNLTL